jgi:hypothetical protein
MKACFTLASAANPLAARFFLVFERDENYEGEKRTLAKQSYKFPTVAP